VKEAAPDAGPLAEQDRRGKVVRWRRRDGRWPGLGPGKI